MKIAIDVSQIVYSGHGVGRYVRGLTHGLLELASPHQFVLYAGALRRLEELRALSKQTPYSQADWHIYPIPPRLARVVFNNLNIPIDQLFGHVDLFHTSDWTEPATRALSVTTVHDLAFRLYPETVDPVVLETQTKRLQRIVNHTTHVIADSLNTKNDLMKEYGLPSARITVVYPGIDSIYKPQKKNNIDRVKKKYALPDQYILSLGTQEPRKNLRRLVEACNGLDTPLVVAGRYGWGDDGPVQRVKNLGYIGESDLPPLYAGASVFAYPSLYEGFGFPVLEAMACGTPVVTSNTSCLPEIAGDAALLVDPLDVSMIRRGIKRAVNSRSTLSKLGLKQAAKYSWEKCAKATMEVYEAIYRN